MNLSELIKQHDEASEQLIRAIEMDDNALVEQFDRQLSSALKDIIALKVDGSELLYKKVNFLLSQIIPSNQRTETTNLLCNQIMADIAEYTNLKDTE